MIPAERITYFFDGFQKFSSGCWKVVVAKDDPEGNVVGSKYGFLIGESNRDDDESVVKDRSI